MKRFVLYLAFLSVPCVLQSADLPPVVIGAENYDQKMCVERYWNDCMNQVCLTSEQRDCSETCRKQAQDKCEEQAQ